MINEIASKINELRKARRMTLKDMSEACGLSVSFLSQVENGTSSLAITSLKKIADALEVPITTFFESHENYNYHITLESQEKWKFEGSQLEYVRLAGNFAEPSMEPLLVAMPPKSSVGQKYSHPGEEFVYVLEGPVLVELDETLYTVQSGESMHYPSTIQHSWSNPSDKEVRLLAVNTPALFK